MPGARLTVEQRQTIERWYRIGLAQGHIASIIGKDKSTVSRELARSFSATGSRSPRVATARGGGAGYRRVYDAERAQRVAEVRARRPKPRRLDAPVAEQGVGVVAGELVTGADRGVVADRVPR
jgi:IS30 family transposase